MAVKGLTTDKLLRENEELKVRLREAEEALNAIRNGEVDAIVVSGEHGDRIFSLSSAETPYRLLLEGIDEGTINTTAEGTILYCNHRFAEMINHPVAQVVGSDIKTLVSGTDKVKFRKLFKKGLRGSANDVISFNLNGNRELIHLKLSVTADPSDTSGHICIVATDVTEMKTHQEKLKLLVEKKTKKIQKANEKLKEDNFKIKRYGEALQESEEKYRKIIETAGEGIIIASPEGQFQYVNQKFADMLGYTREVIMGKKSDEFVYNLRNAVETQKSRNHLKKGKNVQKEMTFIRNDGSLLWTLYNATPLFDSQNNHIGNLAMHTDITERKKEEQIREQLLHEIERQAAWLNASISSMATGIILYGPDGIATHMNETAKKLLPEELFFNSTIEERSGIINWETEDGKPFPVEEIPVKRALTGETINNVVLGAIFHDRKLWISANAAPILSTDGKVTGAVASFLDITENKNAEIALRISEERFRSLVKYAPAAIYEMDIHGKQFYSVNDAMCEILGYTREELLSVKPMELLDESSRNLFRDRINRKLKNQEIDEDVEYKVRKKDGNLIYALITVGNITFTDEVNPHITVVAYNITERRRKEEILKESEKRFRDLIKYAPTAIYELDFTTRKFTSVNDSMCELSGFSREELLKLDPLDLLDEDSRKLFLSRISKSLKGEKPEEDVEYTVRSKDGHMIYAVLNMKFNFNEKGFPVGAMVVGHDITERKKMEQSLMQSEEKLKELIATKDKFFNILAHDLKNPFTSMIGSSEVLYENIHKLTPENIINLAMLLNDSAKSGFTLLQNLLDWSRSQTGLLNVSPEKLNLRKLITENISYLKLSAENKDISIIIESKGDIYLTTDRNMFNTIIRNLLSNSIKFTPKSGEVVVSLKKESGIVTILAIDNGVGISPERIEKLFNLETRNSTPGTENEHGTGLGLKLCKELIEKLGGTIYVESVLGYGSTFRVTLPEKFGDRLLKI
jgi:PAS domain S-box-containing protein